MQRFCTQCGSELKKEYNNCAQCGTPIKKQVNKARKVRGKSEQAKTTPPTRKERKRPIMWGAIIAFIIILIVFPKWVNSNQSPERIVQKFEQAILDDDAKTIKKLLVHEDESAISENEAKAFLKLIKESAGSPYYYPIISGKFLLFFDAYKIVTEDQYAIYDLDDFSFLFNDEPFPESFIDIANGGYGPFVPGVYTVKATYDGKFGEITSEETVTLYNEYGGHTYIDYAIDVDYVTLFLENYDSMNILEARVTVNGEEIKVYENGESEPFGPLPLDGNQEAEIIITTPLGEVKRILLN